MAANEEERGEPNVVYKIKAINFLGRSVPIVLQNDNGPCPLLAICNVLLLRNNLSINPNLGEIPLQNLFAHVAEKLLDSNNDFKHKDDDYVRNQQQNVSDAITLLPRLATGIDVNVRFRHIHDFEFTPECAIFDLLDIDLVHGWLCDPQDEVTSRIIGDNSYNVLVENLVALESSRADFIIEDAGQETSVDFAAATTASLGIPSPSRALSRMKLEGLDFPAGTVRRKGDDEETTQLLQALKLSEIAEVSDFSKACPTGIVAPELATDDLLLKKQENNESLSSRWESTGKLWDSEHDVDSSNQSISSGERLSGEADRICPCPNPTSSSGLVHSTMEVKHEKVSPEDLGSIIAETETHDYIIGQNDIDSTDANLQIHEHSLADRTKQTNESSTSSSRLNLEDRPNDTDSHGGEAYLQSSVKPQIHETLLTDEMKQRVQSTSKSDLKVNESGSCLDSKETDVTSLEEEVIRLLDADERSRLSLAVGTNHAECLCLDDASQYQPDASHIQALDKDQPNLTKEAEVIGSENRLGLLSKQELLVSSEASSIEAAPLPEGTYTKVATDEGTGAYAIDSMAETSNEGESILANAEAVHCVNVREPLYEGEGILIASANESINDAGFSLRLDSNAASLSRNDALSISAAEGFIIKNFLHNHASQLTYHGLFSLQEGLKERELCVFFRNNHFSTMFKYEGDLYILATDQGYLNQPDLVWEKLTEVDGDSVFFTGSFSLFKADDQSHGSWNEQDVLNATTDYISSHQREATELHHNGHLDNYNFSSDLQLAIALQQEELDQQQQQQQQQRDHQHAHVSSPVPPQRGQPGARPSTGLTAGRLFTGPKSSSSASKSDSKSKDKCVVM